MGSLWNRSGTIERYADDLAAAGAKAYFYSGGTTTPMSVFADSGESSAHAFPVVANSRGRWPDVFVPYTTSFDVRVTTADDVQLSFSQQIPNPNPVDVSVTVPPEETVQTGMIHAEFVNTTKAGYVRLNGRTLGDASSTATERANDTDTQDLFVYLWNNLPDTIATVGHPAGRGASGAADWGAHKTIVLPDMRGSTFVGLDDMGNSAASAFTGLTFTVGSATTAGSAIGTNSFIMDVSQLPSHTHAATTSVPTDGAHTHTGVTDIPTDDAAFPGSGTTNDPGNHQHDAFIRDPGHTHGFPSGLAVPTISGGAIPGGTAAGAWSSTAVTASSGTGGTGIQVRSASSGAADDKTAAAGAHTHTVTVNTSKRHTHAITAGMLSTHTGHTHTITVTAAGSGALINNLGAARLVTWFIKL